MKDRLKVLRAVRLSALTGSEALLHAQIFDGNSL